MAQAGGTTRAGAQTAGAFEPEALVVTYWFDPGAEGAPYDATVRLTGRRLGVRGAPTAGDTFVKDEVIQGIVPGSGPISITTRVFGLRPGEWEVNARLIPSAADPRSAVPRPGAQVTLEPASWSWRRWALAPAPATATKTRWTLLAQLARQPAVMPGVYIALAAIGFVLGLALQAVLLTLRGGSFEPALAASLVAIVAGLAGAKVWYKILHPDEPWFVGGGWAVDGFLVVAPVVGALLLIVWNEPVGLVLDATTPGLFLAVAIGRVGCFVTGCCAGRCTTARWGIWSSDRRIGARRIPAQLLEAGAGLALAAVSLLLVLTGGLVTDGVVFVLGFVSYAALRQGLLRLRAERRTDPRTLPLTAAAAGVTAVAVAVLAIVGRA